jgi:hypothetical protein
MITRLATPYPAGVEVVDVATDKAIRHTSRTSSSYEKKGGQVVMGPQQPRPKTQTQIPTAPPRGK